jgi:hypothetical protein
MRRFILLALVVMAAGCMKDNFTFDYNTVYVRYTVAGGLVPPEEHTKVYLVDNERIYYTKAYRNGSVTYSKTGSVTPDEYKALGRGITEAGVYGMLDRYNRSTSDQGEKPTAELYIIIDGRNKTITLNPYVEEFAPGNIAKATSDVKRLTQKLQ